MRRVAVTGGIACGKSLVGAMLAARGVPVCEADALAHSLMAKGSPVYRAVVERFGPGILDGQGEVDRAALGAIVFADAASREALNGLTHPAVRAAWTAWLAAREGTSPVAAVLVPLLYEAGAGDGWDAVLCVAASPAVQRERLRQRGLTTADAEARRAAQMPLADKVERADYVLYNDGTRELLERQVERVFRQIRGE